MVRQRLHGVRAQIERARLHAAHGSARALMAETPMRLDRLTEAATVELGKTVIKNETRLRADYDLTYREIYRRLKAAKETGNA